MPKIANRSSEQTKQVAAFVENLTGAASAGGPVLDSVDAFASESLNQNSGMPENLAKLLDEVGSNTINFGGREITGRALVMKSVLDGINAYTSEHGEAPSADKVEAALYQGYSTTAEARKGLKALDAVSADTNHSDPASMQPNRAVIAIMGSIAEAIPFASYLPYDIGSNEARLIIVGHAAGSNLGFFKQGMLMDGINSGEPYLSTSRTILLDAEGKGKITAEMSDHETCVPGAATVKLLRGRTIIYVQGLPAGGEVGVSGGATSQLGGSITLGGNEHVLTGSVKPDTGEIAATFTPELPSNTKVHAEGFIDLEKQPNLTPKLQIQAQKFQLFANPWRALTEVSIDARTQFANEVGITPETETVLAIRNQFGNERHYQVLRMAERLSINNVGEYKFNWAVFGQQKTRSQIAQDIMAAIFPLEQKMANDTMDHGITHMYIDEIMASTFLCCDSSVFQPSGVAPRPSIYRLGRLLNTYEVYVNPKARSVTADADVSVITCIGRSTQAGRNPFVLGDAVAPMAVPVAAGPDMVNKAGFYARNFTCVNPHTPSALGCAKLVVTGLTKVNA